ncbi:MAG: orotate phosphoribosyltransferase [Candidatus Solibacter usitatus]|nr:orotate phosphoribosyltransferase [Candidatus Solibacter usitatus]
MLSHSLPPDRLEREVALSSDSVFDTFRHTGAFLNGHFRLSSGLHSPQYLQCALVLAHPQHAESMGRALAEALGVQPDVVVSPAMGGLIIGHEVARALGVRHIFTERDAERKMAFRRGFGVEAGQKAVVIEDVITTGGSSVEVIKLLRSAGVEVLAAGSIIDRSGGRADLGVPRVALATLDAVAYDPAECPLCGQGIPVVKPGSRPA